MEGLKKDSILKKKLKTNIQGILQAVWFQVNKYADIIYLYLYEWINFSFRLDQCFLQTKTTTDIKIKSK